MRIKSLRFGVTLGADPPIITIAFSFNLYLISRWFHDQDIRLLRWFWGDPIARASFTARGNHPQGQPFNIRARVDLLLLSHQVISSDAKLFLRNHLRMIQSRLWVGQNRSAPPTVDYLTGVCPSTYTCFSIITYLLATFGFHHVGHFKGEYWRI